MVRGSVSGSLSGPAIEAVASPSERRGTRPAPPGVPWGPGGDTYRINEANSVLDLGGVY